MASEAGCLILAQVWDQLPRGLDALVSVVIAELYSG
jgi:hypothetical protein